MKQLNSFEALVKHCRAGNASQLLIEDLEWETYDWSALGDTSARIPSGNHGKGSDPRGRHEEYDVETLRFQSSCFRQVSFRGSRLTGLTFYQCKFQNCRFDGTDLSEVCFDHCHFYVSDQDLADFTGAIGVDPADRPVDADKKAGQTIKDEAEEAKKVACTFKFARLNAMTMTDCDISLCNFSRSNLYRAEIRNCQAQGADFSESNAGHSPGGSVMLNDATLIDNNFAYADFSGATLREAELSGNRFSHCLFHHACLENSLLTECDFHAIEAEHLTLAGADLRGSNISGLDPRQVDLAGAMINTSQQPMLLEALGLIVDHSFDVD